MLQLQQVQKTLHFIFTKWCLLPLIFSISIVESESEFTESCPTLCEPMNCSLPGFSIHWIVQARVLEWGAFPSPEDLPNPGVELGSPALPSSLFFSHLKFNPSADCLFYFQNEVKILLTPTTVTSAP